ncbi:MAG: rRNA cytosine-C5-methyltransferase [Parabacteroides sp.]|nr:rRNA cytosine-C5-methyltransferase [Parabacteroides sp.]
MALPIDFITRTRALLGDEYTELEKALMADVPVSIRMNPKKSDKHPEATPVPWSHLGYYLPERLSFTFDPLFQNGTYYVQEASSMFLEQAIKAYVQEPVVCLDLCAAPGGKSTHLLSLLPEGSVLVSNEVIRSRSYILAENIQKWGYPNHVVTNNDPAELGELTHLFDVIVTDVPCSGEGMFRKDTASTGEWSVANVELCASRQRRILHDIWNALKPGGLLVYSTCTYNTEEDEENIQYIIDELGAEPLPILIDDAWGVCGALKYANPVYRFFPHRTRGEGFFLAALRKADGEREELRIKTKNKDKKQKGKKQPDIPASILSAVRASETYQPVWNDIRLSLLPSEVQAIYPLLQEKLHILSAGIELGEWKGKDWVPAQALALSTALNPTAFPVCEVDDEMAIRYFRKEALVLPADAEKGYVLLTYQQRPIGFVKNLGNRANNLYPQEWRIRSSYNPEEIRRLVL